MLTVGSFILGAVGNRLGVLLQQTVPRKLTQGG
jgi:hypothetical protein